MNSYLSGTTVKLAVSFLDDDGNDISIIEAKYRIIDENGLLIKPYAAFETSEAEVTIAPEFNTLEPIDYDAISADQKDSVLIDRLRVLEFDLTTEDGNVIPYDITYTISPRERLITGINSFQTLNQSKLLALTIPDAETFLNEPTNKVIPALIEAQLRISMLNFTECDLSQLKPKDFEIKLTGKFKTALRKAQIAEANSILGGGDQIENAINQGLKSKTIGETHESYLGGKPLNLMVSKSALKYLSGFIKSNKSITRS